MCETGTTPPKTILELYKLYIEMADRISQRREVANNYLFAINTILISLMALSLSFFIKANDTGLDLTLYAILAVSIIGCINCRVWYILIKSYQSTNNAKFKVITSMEEIIGYKPYSTERKHLDEQIYIRFKNVESSMPLSFFVGYVIVMICVLFTLFFDIYLIGDRLEIMAKK